MARYFKWEEKYSVGVQNLDSQHKFFFELTNAINDAVQSPKKATQKTKLTSLLIDLGKYAQFHLDYEENCINRFKCPGHEDHSVAHAVYREKVTSFLKALNDEAIDIRALAEEVADFTQEWLSKHILHKDQEYKPCLSTKDLS